MLLDRPLTQRVAHCFAFKLAVIAVTVDIVRRVLFFLRVTGSKSDPRNPRHASQLIGNKEAYRPLRSNALQPFNTRCVGRQKGESLELRTP